jgi:competence protein ComEC
MPLLPILRKSPFARLILLFAAGIAVADSLRNCTLPVEGLAITLVILWIGLLIIIITYRNFHTGWVAGILAGIILFLCGVWAGEIGIQRGERILSLPESAGIYKIRITDMPGTYDQRLKTTARVLASCSEHGWVKQHMQVLLFFRTDSCTGSIHPGSELIVKTSLKNVPPPGNPGEFNYQQYLATRHIYKQGFVISGSWKVCDGSRGISLQAMACNMRNSLLQYFSKLNLHPAGFGLVSALTLGYKEDVDAHTKQVFSEAGVMHIMALSGFNVGIIALVLGYVLGIFDRNRPGRVGKTILIILFLWLFALITGLSPSVMRATVMISFVMTGRLFHRQVNTYNILFVSAFILLAISPGMLTDVSFQLSFAAVTGIILFQPGMNKLFYSKNHLVQATWQLFTLSCAAQLSTFPLTLYYFHQFPVYFWLTNLYVVPLVSFIICVAGAYLPLAWFKPAVFLFGKLLGFLLKFLLASVSLVEKLPCSLISHVYINGIQAGILMVLVLLVALFLVSRNTGLYWVWLGMLIIFGSLQIGHHRAVAVQRICLVGNLRGNTAVNLISGRKAVIILNHDKLPASQLTYALGNFWIAHGLNPSSYYFENPDTNLCNGMVMNGLYCHPNWRGRNMLISFEGLRMAVLSDNDFFKYQSIRPLRVDWAVVTGNLAVNPSRIRSEIQPALFILDSTVKSYRVEQWKKACKESGIRLYVVSEQGAYLSEVPGK